jgi:gamma-glutamylcyclotransferase (GGCT)/AIG2-like uncharacterized protein YtfP
MLAGSERTAAQCYTEGKLYDTGLGFPAMTQERGNGVNNEMYRVTPGILQRLDALVGYYGEGQNNHYMRVIQSIHTDTGEMKVYVYVYPVEKVDGLDCIELGDWKFHRFR